VRSVRGSRREWIIERTGAPNIDDLKPFLDELETTVQAMPERIS
jgi:hypothetical protein